MTDLINTFVPLVPVNAKPNQRAIVTILDEDEIGNGVTSKSFEKFIGRLSDSDYAEITEALQETQRVDKIEGLVLRS